MAVCTSLSDIRAEGLYLLGISEHVGVEHPHYAVEVKQCVRAMESVLEAYPWCFARKWVELASDGDGYYALPEDYVVAARVGASVYEITAEGIKVRSGEKVGRLKLHYVSNGFMKELLAGGRVRLPGFFVDAVVAESAVRMSAIQSGDMKNLVGLKQFAKMTLEDAATKDVYQFGSNGRSVNVVDRITGEDGDFYEV